MSRPRVGFVGTGWIGRHRMEAMIASGAVEPAWIVEPDAECARQTLAIAPDARLLPSFQAMLAEQPDGVVVATPSALHADQSIQALRAGAAVFCQKPLGRDAPETEAVVAAARKADRLLGVDLSYRHTDAMRAIASLIANGELGRLFAIDLVFHNAYGPDKPWFYDRAQSGGGCLIDLGVHLADLALWITGFPKVDRVSASLRAAGDRVRGNAVEDFASASFQAGDVVVRLACSWRLHAGQDAVIGAAFHGTRGGVSMSNVDGSFLKLRADRFDGTRRTRLCDGADEWGGRAAVEWAQRLAAGERFNAEALQYVDTATLLDRIVMADQGH